jgi:serine/threonine protein kinase
VLVLERCTGGDLWTVIYEEESLRDDDGFLHMDVVRFYAGSIALALEHMHDRNIAYRNLKPETVLLDRNGYIRLTGMGFAKRVPFINAQGTLSGQTFTFCGTLEYLSPEMVLNLGHNEGVDKWALGVTIYEMITGITPFEIDVGPSTVGTRRNSREFPQSTAMGLSMMLREAASALADDQKPGEGEEGYITHLSSSETESVGSMQRQGSNYASEAMVMGTPRTKGLAPSPHGGQVRRSLDNDPTGSRDREKRGTQDKPPGTGGISSPEPERRKSHISVSSASGGKSRGGSDTVPVDNTSKLIATIAGARNVASVTLPHDFTHIKGGIEVTLLLTQLLMPDPSERLGIRRDYVNNIFEHEFFADYDWEHLLDGRGHRCNDVQPPYIPHAQADIKMGRRGAEELPPLPKSEPFTGNNAIFADF